MLVKWKGAVDNRKVFGALSTDFAKAIDCLVDELIIAKLNASGFNFPALRLIHDYLANRWQRTKTIHVYSSREEVVFRAPKGPVFGSILFNIFLTALFLIIDETESASHADDNTVYDAGSTIEGVNSVSSVNSVKSIFNNEIQVNSGKCHLISNTDEPPKI